MRVLPLLLACYLLPGCSGEKTGSEEGDSNNAQQVIVNIDAEQLYAHNCLPCHAEGPGHPGTMQLGLRLGEDRAVLTARQDLPAAYVKTIVRQGLNMMPPFRPAEITDPELEVLASYIAGKSASLVKGQ